MKIKNKYIAIILLIGMAPLLTGCGTMVRGSSTERTYPGFHEDQRVASNLYYWMFSLGLLPVFSIVSMPIDIVVDTILLPYDIYSYPRKYNKDDLLIKEKELMEKIKRDSAEKPLL